MNAIKMPFRLLFLAISTLISISASSDNLLSAKYSWNFVNTIIPTHEYDNESFSINNPGCINQVHAFDHLGRPARIAWMGASPTGGDIFKLLGYDAAGRLTKDYAPVHVPDGIGHDNFNFTDKILIHMITNPASEYYAGDKVPYSEFLYEPSTLNRKFGAIGAGEDWRTANKRTFIEYCTNNPDPNSDLFVNLITIPSQCQNNSFTVEGIMSYSHSALSGLKYTDEDGNISYEFKDLFGNIILKRQMLYGEKHDTYYLYNQSGLLQAIIPPSAADNISEGDNLNNNPYVYLYCYDNYDRITFKKLPGSEPVNYVYDTNGNLVISQTGNQHVSKRASFYKYDYLGRIIIWGECRVESIDAAAAMLQNKTAVESYIGSVGIMHGYTDNIKLGTANVVYMVNYYDNYDFLQFPSISGKEIACSGEITYNDKPRSMLTGRYLAAFTDDSGREYSSFYYDKRDNLVYTATSSVNWWKENTTILYNFVNQPVRKTHSFIRNTERHCEVYNYAYDHAGRLTETKYMYGSNPEITLSKNEYNAIGQLTKKIRYNDADTIYYEYNIRGWVTGLNSKNYSQKLYYQNPPSEIGATPCYNGNISATENNYQYYGFKQKYMYDGLNRLTGSQTKESTHSQVSFIESKDYDKMGNPTSIYRVYGPYTNTQSIYMEYNGNQIKKINASTQNPYPGPDQMRYPNLSTADTEYHYDKNGNMCANLDYDIVTIRNNVLNLPDTVQFKNGNQIGNFYLADGRNLITTVMINLTPIVVPMDSILYDANMIMSSLTEQHGNVYIDDSVLSRVYNDEGYLSLYNKETRQPEFKYYFYNTDYLGNIMTVNCFNEPDAPMQQNRYFPSGAHIEFMAQNPELQQNKFGGKEFIPMHGIDWYDFAARIYSPLTGRFNSIDPLAEVSPWQSPYAYCSGNPINKIDPSGMADFWRRGKNIGNDGKDDKKVYVMKTIKKEFVNNTSVKAAGLSRKDAGAARKFVKDYSGSSEAFSKNSQIYDNFVEIEGDESKRQAMVNEVTKDDGSGRPFANNSREYGGYINSDGVQMEEPGPVYKPGSGRVSIAMYKNRSSFHSHPSLSGDNDNIFSQSPSQDDLNNTGNKTSYVFGRYDNKVYIYNGAAIQGVVPMHYFVKPKK